MNYIKDQIISTRAYLPNLRPLTEFVHFNLYYNQQDKPFWQALEDISLKYSILPLPPLRYYQDLYAKGWIDNDILNSQIKNQNSASDDNFENLKKQLFQTAVKVHLPEKTYRPINKHINEKINYSLKEITEPVLIRFLSGFFDQGLSHWKMPFNDKGLLQCFKDLILHSYIAVYPIQKDLIKKIYNLNAYEIIDMLLSELFEDDDLKKTYIEESILSLKGWSALISSISAQPNLMKEDTKATLEDYLAIRFLIERSWIDILGVSLEKFNFKTLDAKRLQKKPLIDKNSWLSYKIWHESFENTYHFSKLKQIQEQALQFRKQKSGVEQEFSIQALFCIDDREILFRSNLEKENPQIMTFGTPGHFGLDINYFESSESLPQKHCPPPINPKHNLVGMKQTKSKNLFKLFHSNPKYSHNINFKVFKDNEDSNAGFSAASAASRLSVVFKSIGLKNFAPLIYCIGHEATTTNNPFFNAYGCGACSGRSGYINAVTFARLANDAKVRIALAQHYDIHIPKNTYFIAAIHNTTSETFKVLDDEAIPNELESLHGSFLTSTQAALKKNSMTRADDFELIKKHPFKVDYINDLKLRSESLFEPRPELGHTSNAICLVARRDISVGINFERRAFMQSYNYQDDTDGKILSSILAAAVPVCGGINLDYFFAAINAENIGSGSKLSHNIVGLAGLSHGTEDDLLPGLAQQMIELHRPIRMLFVIEQNLEVIKSLMISNSDFRLWVENGWVKLACLCPILNECFYYDQGVFKQFDMTTSNLITNQT